MKIKMFMMSILASLMVVATISAQPQAPQKRQPQKRSLEAKTPEEQATKRTEAMAKNLNLSELQKDQVYKLNLEAAQQKASSKTEMKNQHKKYSSALVDILDKEQVAKMAQSQRKLHGKKMVGKSGGNRPQRLQVNE